MWKSARTDYRRAQDRDYMYKQNKKNNEVHLGMPCKMSKFYEISIRKLQVNKPIFYHNQRQ